MAWIKTNLKQYKNEQKRIDEYMDYKVKKGMEAHKTSAVLDHPDGSVTDEKIGNRTMVNPLSPSEEVTGTLTWLLSVISNAVQTLRMNLSQIHSTLDTKIAQGDRETQSLCLTAINDAVDELESKIAQGKEELDKSLDKLDSSVKENSDNISLLKDRVIIPSDNSLFEFELNEDGKSYSVRMSDTSDVSGLTEIVIPYKYNGLPVTIIPNEGFQIADVPKIVIPNGITYIGDLAFDNLVKLTDINIPNGVTTISQGCFQGCEELRNITIPKSIVDIQTNAFYGCDKLTNVYYEGSEEQWKVISIEKNNECLENANIHFNYVDLDTYATKVEFSEYTDYAEETYATKEELNAPKESIVFANGIVLKPSIGGIRVTSTGGAEGDLLISNDGETHATYAECDSDGNNIGKTYATKEELKNTFANAIKATASGEVIRVDDVSPIEHTVGIKLSSDTITDFSVVNLTVQGKNWFNNDTSLIKQLSYFSSSGSYKRYGYAFYLPAGTYTVRAIAKEASFSNVFLYGYVLDKDWNVKSSSVHTVVNNACQTKTFTISEGDILIQVDGTTGQLSNAKSLFSRFNIQLELGENATEFEPYIAPVTYTPNADGTVDGVKSIYPSMTMRTDTSGVVVNAEYNADTKAYIDKKLAELQALILEG